MNLHDRKKTSIMSDRRLSIAEGSSYFSSAEPIGVDCYEVEMSPKSRVMHLPFFIGGERRPVNGCCCTKRKTNKQFPCIGYQILSAAKIFLDQVVHGFMARWWDRSCWQLLYADTDVCMYVH